MSGVERAGEPSQPLDVAAVQEELRLFAERRNWIQYHTPKNLAAALAVEAAELLEIFQWLTPEESTDSVNQEAVAAELADVVIYALRLADIVDVDLARATRAKLDENARRFPEASG